MNGSDTARHARSFADKLRRAAEEGQSPWTGEGTCLVFADAAKTLKALLARVDSLEAEREREYLACEKQAFRAERAESERDELRARVDVLTEVAQAAQALIDVEDRIEESGRDDVDARWNAYAKLESVLAAVGVPLEQANG